MSEYERPAAVSDQAAEPVDAAVPSAPATEATVAPSDPDAAVRASANDAAASPSTRNTTSQSANNGLASTSAEDAAASASAQNDRAISVGTRKAPSAPRAGINGPGAASGSDPFAPDDDDDARWAAEATGAADEDRRTWASDIADTEDHTSTSPAAHTADADSDTSPIWASGAEDDERAVAATGATPAGKPSTLLRPRNLVLISLVVILLVVVGIFGPTAWEVWSERDVHIDTPPRINSLELDDSQGAHDTVDYMQNAIKTSVTLERTTGAVYAESSGDSKSVVFVGGTGTLVTPSEALDKSFSLITDEAGGVDGVHEVAAGPLGGTMKCGTTTTDGNGMAVCGWADHGSLGIAMFPNRKVNESAELLRTMRKAMQTRS